MTPLAEVNRRALAERKYFGQRLSYFLGDPWVEMAVDSLQNFPFARQITIPKFVAPHHKNLSPYCPALLGGGVRLTFQRASSNHLAR